MISCKFLFVSFRLLFIVSIVSLANMKSQAQMTVIQNIDTAGVKSGDNLTSLIPDVRFTGIGSLITRSGGQGFDQSANISGEFNLGFNKNWTFMLGFNLGNKLDSSYVDSVSLKDIFYPDRSRIGFTGYLSWDILRSKNPFKWKDKTLWDIPGKTRSLAHVNSERSDKFEYWQLLPTLEGSYQRRNFIGVDSLPTTRLETFSFVSGVRIWYKKHIGQNQFGFTAHGYRKQQAVSDATLDTYRLLFNDDNGGKQLTRHGTFLGLSVGLMINDALVSFTYENLLTNGIINKDVSGGVYLIKVSIGADFLEFK